MDYDEFTNTSQLQMWPGDDHTGFNIIVIAKPKAQPVVYCRFNYQGDSWLHFDQATFKYEYNQEECLRQFTLERENKKEYTVASNIGVCVEYIDIPLDADLENFLLKLSQSKNVMLRLNGTTNYKNYTYYSYWLPYFPKALKAINTLRKDALAN